MPGVPEALFASSGGCGEEGLDAAAAALDFLERSWGLLSDGLNGWAGVPAPEREVRRRCATGTGVSVGSCESSVLRLVGGMAAGVGFTVGESADHDDTRLADQTESHHD